MAKAIQKIIDIHTGQGDCFTLRLGWYLRIQGEGRYYQITEMQGTWMRLDTYQLKDGQGKLTTQGQHYGYNADTFSYRAQRGELICQKQPFGKHITPPPPKRKAKPKETPAPPKAAVKPAPIVAETTEKDSILDLFGI